MLSYQVEVFLGLRLHDRVEEPSLHWQIQDGNNDYVKTWSELCNDHFCDDDDVVKNVSQSLTACFIVTRYFKKSDRFIYWNNIYTWYDWTNVKLYEIRGRLRDFDTVQLTCWFNHLHVTRYPATFYLSKNCLYKLNLNLFTLARIFRSVILQCCHICYSPIINLIKDKYLVIIMKVK